MPEKYEIDHNLLTQLIYIYIFTQQLLLHIALFI